MDKKIYASENYLEEVKKTRNKEAELIRLLQVKAEKITNKVLAEKYFTQLSFLSKEEQEGALAIPKGIILDKMLNYLRSI